MGDRSGDGCFSAIGIGRMNLDKGISEVAEFNSNGSVGGVDGFFFAAEGSAFDPFKAKPKGGGFTKY
jgi:hypothetical protein